ncbi:AAA family ATPase [Demetria terragena]|uniref:AAA family ATPase n=1 Tax=Demetria terragena TaxID=63959 RepID=UPI00036B9837|nr:hypothetical protein [Demetria terragena]
MTALLTAVTPALEAGVATRVEATRELRLARRCADIPDLLASAASHVAQAAVVSADFPGLERRVVGALAGDGVRVVGVFAPGDEEAQRRLRQLGIDRVISAAASPEEWTSLAMSLAEPQHELDPDSTSSEDRDASDVDTAIAREILGAQATDPGDGAADNDDDGESAGTGRIVAVWGPTGSPGRTTVAINVACEVARLGKSVLLIDGDTYGASVAQAMALLDEAPGLAAATRLAETGDLDVPRLAAVAPEATNGVRVLTGLPRADRWSEVREDSFAEVLTVARLLVDLVVIDTGFCLEEDEELSYDTRAPRRNVTTTIALRDADEVIAVGSGDPVGLQRLVRGLDELSRITAAGRVVVNRVRASAVGTHPERRVSETLERFAGVAEPVIVPDDRPTLDGAMLAGQSLAEAAPGSEVRRVLAELAGAVAGVDVVLRRRGIGRRLVSRTSSG